MPDPAMIDQQPFWAAATALLAGGLLWLWRGFSLGVKIGELVQEVRGLRGEVLYIRERLDTHIDGDKK